MKLSRFVNNLNSIPLHSSGLAGDGAPAPQSFTERQQVEQHRNLIQGYQQSLTGMARLERGSVRPTPRPNSPTIPTATTRQQFNAPGGQTFREPPTRGFNPYS
jgi:hypothetical protein